MVRTRPIAAGTFRFRKGATELPNRTPKALSFCAQHGSTESRTNRPEATSLLSIIPWRCCGIFGTEEWTFSETDTRS
jgi:hypothetical protein